MKLFLLASFLFSLFIYAKCKSCIDIEPNSAEDCVPSTQDPEYTCCYVSFRGSRIDYEVDDIDKKCLPFDIYGQEELEEAFDQKDKYKSYGYIDTYSCIDNNKYNNDNDNDNFNCEMIQPEKPSDCKLSSSESNNIDMCCYIKDINNVKYCEKLTKSEVDSFVDRNTNKEFVCISYDSFLKESLLILLLFLFF